MQFRVGLSYIAVILAVLLLLNTYPLLVSEDLVFHSKATNLQSSVSVMASLERFIPRSILLFSRPTARGYWMDCWTACSTWASLD